MLTNVPTYAQISKLEITEGISMIDWLVPKPIHDPLWQRTFFCQIFKLVNEMNTSRSIDREMT